jgi:two-component system chemotaxis sensor kinase CheA
MSQQAKEHSMELSQPADGSNNLLGEMAEVINEFLVESNEGLDRFDRDLIALEKDKTSRELLDSIFRAIHTIKGTGGVLGYEKLVSVSHLGESVLSRMRDGILVLSPEIATALLVMADSLRRMLENIAAAGNEGDENNSSVLQQLSAVLQQAQQAAMKPAVSAVPLVVDSPPRLGEILVDSQSCKAQDVTSAVELQDEGDARPIGEILVEKSGVCPTAVAEGLKAQSDFREIVNNTIRVDVALLDKVMNLVGELVLARNQVLQFTDTQENSTFLSTAQRLNLITTELQEGVMKTRMQPIGNVWNKLPRIVRDLSMACGKCVEVAMEGAQTELDKTIIEAIKDPLTHLIRNAVDHGIEMPEARAAAGKSREGHLVLRAFHEGGQVNIEVSDDGGGIDVDKIKAKAIAKGMLTADQAARLPEREVLQLAFAPGLSTAEQVSNISGRGVGMDVVKTNIEKIGGTVDLQSTPGKGTLLKIKIPLTLAIIPALMVTSGGERFAIPQVSLIELVHCEGEQAGHSIESVHGASVYRLRGNLLPLVYLNRELQLNSPDASASVNIVVLLAGDRQFGLVVDEINDTEEIVVKPLSKELKSVSCFAGATIMGDGHVALILDVLGLAQKAGAMSDVCDQAIGEGQEARNTEQALRQNWLLFRSGTDSRLALPLSAISRLEEFSLALIEHSGDQEVVQYREQIMPLVRMSRLLEQPATAIDPLPVVVFSAQGRSLGLIVDRIEDITEEAVEVRSQQPKRFLLGSAVIQQRVTDVVDLQQVVGYAAAWSPVTAEGRA